MNVITTVIRGEIGGRRAEVRLEDRVVRVQTLTVVSQQPGLDISVPIADLLAFRLRSRIQWYFGAALMAIGAYSWYQGVGTASPEASEAMAVLFGVLGVVGLGLGVVFPLLTLEVADRDHGVVVQLSRFSRARARHLVRAVQSLNPALAEPAA